MFVCDTPIYFFVCKSAISPDALPFARGLFYFVLTSSSGLYLKNYLVVQHKYNPRIIQIINIKITLINLFNVKACFFTLLLIYWFQFTGE